MAEELSLSYYLPLAGGRIIGFIPFPRVLVLCEMQSVSSRIWTRNAVFISYGDNDYTTGTYVKGKQSRLRFKHMSPCPFPSTLTNTSQSLRFDTPNLHAVIFFQVFQYNINFQKGIFDA